MCICIIKYYAATKRKELELLPTNQKDFFMMLSDREGSMLRIVYVMVTIYKLVYVCVCMCIIYVNEYICANFSFLMVT